jgi:hypothetical protein
MGNTSESQLPTAEIFPSKPQDEQNISSEFFDNGDVNGIKPQSNAEQTSQESRIKNQPKERFIALRLRDSSRGLRRSRYKRARPCQEDDKSNGRVGFPASLLWAIPDALHGLISH